jgi:hypothetical protein
MVNLIVILSIMTCPCSFMKVKMWEHGTFDNQIFGYGEVYYSSSIIIIYFVQTLIPNCRFENVLSAYFGIKIS